MNISVTIPVEYACGETIDMFRYGFRGLGIVVDSRQGQSNVECEVPDKEVSLADRMFSLAEDIFGVTKDEIQSPRRFERLLFPRIAISHALLTHGNMISSEVCKILNRDRASLYHYGNNYDNLNFIERSIREKMIEFDERAKLILT